MSLTVSKKVLSGVDVTFKEKGLDIICTFTLKTNNVWNGEPFTLTFKDNDSHFHTKTVTVETVKNSTETITKKVAFSYASMSVTVRGYSTTYLGEQITLGNLVNNVPNSTLSQSFTGDYADENSGIFQFTLVADTGYKFVEDSLQNDVGGKFDYYNNFTVAKQLGSNSISNLNIGWTFTGETVAKGTKIINNITGNCDETHTVDGTNVSITVTGNSDYAKFVGVSVEYTDINDKTKTVVPDFSGNVINISLTDVKEGTNVIL